MERLFEMDGQLLLWIREVFASPVMDKIMIFISSLANKGMLWIGIGVVLLLLGVKGRKWSNRGLLVLLSLAFNMVICNLLLKPLVARTRPYDLLGYEILVRRLGGYSFPSGHHLGILCGGTWRFMPLTADGERRRMCWRH